MRHSRPTQNMHMLISTVLCFTECHVCWIQPELCCVETLIPRRNQNNFSAPVKKGKRLVE